MSCISQIFETRLRKNFRHLKSQIKKGIDGGHVAQAIVDYSTSLRNSADRAKHTGKDPATPNYKVISQGFKRAMTV